MHQPRHTVHVQYLRPVARSERLTHYSFLVQYTGIYLHYNLQSIQATPQDRPAPPAALTQIWRMNRSPSPWGNRQTARTCSQPAISNRLQSFLPPPRLRIFPRLPDWPAGPTTNRSFNLALLPPLLPSLPPQITSLTRSTRFLAHLLLLILLASFATSLRRTNSSFFNAFAFAFALSRFLLLLPLAHTHARAYAHASAHAICEPASLPRQVENHSRLAALHAKLAPHPTTTPRRTTAYQLSHTHAQPGQNNSPPPEN